MAQRDKEETEVQITETRILCVNNCGFHGNPATNNMCQSCFQASPAAGSPAALSCSGRDKPARSHRARPVGPAEESKAEEEQRAPAPAEDRIPKAREVKRCYGCRKRVGLTGFRCRCGEIFCGDHRYSDRHVCSFDYKAAGREAIARENPVVRAAKIVRV